MQTQPERTESFSADDLVDRMIYRRAVEAVIWGMPAVNYDLMFQAMVKAGGKENQIVYWSNLLDWKNQTLTPNPGAIYLMPFMNTKDAGPIVLEIPPAGDDGLINGNVCDAWQIALEDVGPAGVDKGKGCKCLILPPGYKDKVPDGYTAFPSDTYQNFALLRSILKGGSDADIAKAVAYGKRVKLYPLSQAANPPETIFVDASGVVFDSTIPYDLRYFQSLDRIVQAEPWFERDRALIDPLRTIGIEKGKSFSPNTKTQEILKQAAVDAHAWLDGYYETLFNPPFYEGSHWALPVSPDVVRGQSTGYTDTDIYPLDARGATYAMAFIGAKRLGSGQYYLVAIRDKQGQPLSGANQYHLVMPADVPVQQYWSATIYDAKTHAFIRNLPSSTRSSQSLDLLKNPDGAVDLYFGPKAPDGKESNWIPTGGHDFEIMMRFYGPEKALFEKTWVLPDVERIG